ncbi:MAG: dinB 3, partial [Acidobacteria bacterium]|nr:dinB 3 [Acidobacteriota bacterium]
GEDDREVEPERPAKSSGTESTYPQDLADIARIREEVASMAREGAAWLLRHELFARTVTIKVRYGNFSTVTRSHSACPATRDPDAIAARAVELLQKTEAGRRSVRLLGVSVHNFSDTPGEARRERPPRPLPLFDQDDDARP